MAHIRIDYDGLAQNASKLNSINASYESLNTRLKAMEQVITSGWEGQASKAYDEMMRKYIAQSMKMGSILHIFTDYANKVPEDFQEVDRTCAALIRNSF